MALDSRNSSSSRLGREEWLGRALDALAQEGGSVLTIDKLVQRLGVSRGSFYWHFRNRADFARQLVEYWSELFTLGVAREIENQDGNADDRLHSLAALIVNQDLARYDIAIRAWASIDPEAATAVRKVDKFRENYVRLLFHELGFVNDELETRTRTFTVFYSLEPGLFVGLSKKKRLKQIPIRHTILTQR